MNTRRHFLKRSVLGAGAMALGPQYLFAKNPTGKPPMRFIFLTKGNGLVPTSLIPPSLSEQNKAIEAKKGTLDIDLDKHELAEWMRPVEAHKEHMTILQGISGKMCTTGHNGFQSALGAFRANGKDSALKWATVDFELAKLSPSPFHHIELACFFHAHNPVNGIGRGCSARGPLQGNHAFGAPKLAVDELFKSVSSKKSDQAELQMDKEILEFMARKQKALYGSLDGTERSKIFNYSESVESIRKRNQQLESMTEVIRKNKPDLDKKYLQDDMTTVDRQFGHAEVMLAAMKAGLTNVGCIGLDYLPVDYTGLLGLENDIINQHNVGHAKQYKGKFTPEIIRGKIRHQHMRIMAKLVEDLKAVPEGTGTMFDNTMIFYLPSQGETHHSSGIEWPFVIMAGKNAKLNLGSRYIRLPGYGQEGHKTLGNLYTTLLNAYGNPIKHYGEFDLGLTKYKIDQSGPIEQFLV
jgi:hypothetical protein